jgi:hypothetical protein
MALADADWEERVSELWAEIDGYEEHEFVARIDELVAELPPLALVDLGREREAVAVALTALSEYLPRYNRSVAGYAQQLTPPTG